MNTKKDLYTNVMLQSRRYISRMTKKIFKLSPFGFQRSLGLLGKQLSLFCGMGFLEIRKFNINFLPFICHSLILASNNFKLIRSIVEDLVCFSLFLPKIVNSLPKGYLLLLQDIVCFWKSAKGSINLVAFIL